MPATPASTAATGPTSSRSENAAMTAAAGMRFGTAPSTKTIPNSAAISSTREERIGSLQREEHGLLRRYLSQLYADYLEGKTSPVSSSLPLIPLEDAIVLPGMALSFDLASAEANAAVDEAMSALEPRRGQVVLVPRHEGRFARIGVVAVIEGEPAMLPQGHRGVTLRALHRAELGRAEAAGGALRIDVTERPDPTDMSDELAERVRAFRAVLESILDARGASRI